MAIAGMGDSGWVDDAGTVLTRNTKDQDTIDGTEWEGVTMAWRHEGWVHDCIDKIRCT